MKAYGELIQRFKDARVLDSVGAMVRSLGRHVGVLIPARDRPDRFEQAEFLEAADQFR